MKRSIATVVWMVGILAGAYCPVRAEVEGMPILNLKGSTPQGVSAELGWLFGEAGSGGSWANEAKGPCLSIEPGLSGTRVHAGYGSMLGTIGGFGGYRLTASYLRMNEDAGSFEDGESYIGADFTFSFMFLVFNLGAYMPAGGDGDPGVSVGIGIGF